MGKNTLKLKGGGAATPIYDIKTPSRRDPRGFVCTKLIVNKWEAPEAAPINYSINFILETSKHVYKSIIKLIKIIKRYKTDYQKNNKTAHSHLLSN